MDSKRERSEAREGGDSEQGGAARVREEERRGRAARERILHFSGERRDKSAGEEAPKDAPQRKETREPDLHPDPTRTIAAASDPRFDPQQPDPIQGEDRPVWQLVTSG